MNKIKSLAEKLQKTLESKYIIDSPLELSLYASDGLKFHSQQPALLVLPANTDELRHIIEICFDWGIPFVPRAAGTGLSGGALSKGGVIIQMSRMNRILEIRPEDQIALVQAGVTNQAVSDAASKYNLFFQPDPSSQVASSISGNIAENAGGPHCLKYGMTKDHVLGFKTIMPNAEIRDFSLQHPTFAASDLSQFWQGSEGTLGIITEATLKLFPTPQSLVTFLLVFDGIDEATRCVESILSASILPVAIEMMDKLTIKAVEQNIEAGLPSDAGAVLIVELQGDIAELTDDAARLPKVVKEFISAPIKEARNSAERAQLWLSRKHATGSLGKITSGFYTNDGVVPPDRIAEIHRKIAEISENRGLAIANVCHAGDGNVHPLILFNANDPEERKLALRVSDDIIDACLELGGSITGEHGVGIEKRSQLSKMLTNEEIAICKDLKAVFDENGICNPGKIFPD